MLLVTACQCSAPLLRTELLVALSTVRGSWTNINTSSTTVRDLTVPPSHPGHLGHFQPRVDFRYLVGELSRPNDTYVMSSLECSVRTTLEVRQLQLVHQSSVAMLVVLVHVHGAGSRFLLQAFQRLVMARWRAYEKVDGKEDAIFHDFVRRRKPKNTASPIRQLPAGCGSISRGSFKSTRQAHSLLRRHHIIKLPLGVLMLVTVCFSNCAPRCVVLI